MKFESAGKTCIAVCAVVAWLMATPTPAAAQITDSAAVRQNTFAAARYLKSVYKIDDAIDTLSTLVGAAFDEEVMAELADCHFQNGDYENAAGTYFMLSLKVPGNLQYKVRNTVVLYRLKAYEGAASAGIEVLKMDTIPAIASLVGDAFNQLERFDDALEYYNLALAKKPLYESVVNKICKIYLGREDYDGVIAAADAFLELSPDNPVIAPVKGFALYLKGEYAPAIELLERQLSLGNDSYGVHYNLGQCYWQTKKLIKADEELEAAWQIDSSDVNLAYSIAAVKSESYPFLHFETEVKPWLDRALAMIEPDPAILSRIHQQYGLGYYSKEGKDNAWDKAIEHYKEAYKYNNKNISALSVIGYCYERKKDYKTALQWYERYLKVARPGSSGYDYVTKSVDYIKGELFMEE